MWTLQNKSWKRNVLAVLPDSLTVQGSLLTIFHDVASYEQVCFEDISAVFLP